MITTVTTTTTAAATTTTSAAVGAQIVGIGIFAILVLIALLILRDISMVELEDRKTSNREHGFLSSFVNSSTAFIVPLCYVFLSIIVYKFIIIV